MKRRLTSVLLIMTMFTLAACGSNSGNTSANPPPASQTSASEATDPVESETEITAEPDKGETETVAETETGSNILIAYFAVPETDGTDAVAGASRVIVDSELLANTQYIAQVIEEETGGDLFRIETVQEYPGVHAPLLDFADKEKAENARPELSTSVENISDYDVIFIGYPNWWADLPMPLYTFLENYDLSGKTIVPFSTHGGSGFSRTISTIADLQPNATVIEDGLTVSRNSIASAYDEVASWVTGLGY